MELTTYPLNNIEYSAEDAELFHVTRTSGVYANNSFDYSVTGADNTIVIGTGIGWIKNSEFAGKVIALKDKVSLDMGLPDSVYPRIDAIVIQFDANMNATNIIVKNGTASSEPIPPEVSRDDAVYELHLYHVKREAGSLSITPSNITDLRINSSYCGLMADSVTSIDTSAIEKQFSDLIEYLQNKISNVEDGSSYLFRDGSNNMTGDLLMSGNKVTGLGTPTGAGDAVSKGYANKNFAPLIDRGVYVGSINTVNNSDGLYTNSVVWVRPGETTGLPYENYGICETWAAAGSILIQRITYINNAVCFRFYFDGGDGAAWGNWCWDNPPMVLGTEYLTARRWNGKAVYAKLISFGALPNASNKSLSISSIGVTNILHASATTSAGAYIPFDYSQGSVTYKMHLAADKSYVSIRTEHDANAETAVVLLMYTKT